MPAAQLRETTMNPDTRTLLRVTLPDARASMMLTEAIEEDNEVNTSHNYKAVDDLVEQLMGKNADARFRFIQDNAEFVEDIDI